MGKKPPKDDLIFFCRKDGTPIHTSKKGFEEIIKNAGVGVERNGEKRTIYSLRHTYATLRLQEGVNHYVPSEKHGAFGKDA